MIIGLAGYARSGKDEAVKALVAAGWERRAFADKLREFAYRLNPIVGVSPYGQTEYLVDVINRYTWDGYKETEWGEEIRRILQRIGTECGRQLISDTIWIDAALGPNIAFAPKVKIAVSDVRFPNEAQAIKARGGKVIRIRRPGIVPANAHASETALDDWNYDAVINNDKTIEVFHARVLNAVNGLR